MKNDVTVRRDVSTMSTFATVTNDDNEVTETDALSMSPVRKMIPKFVHQLAKKGSGEDEVNVFNLF